MLNCFILFYLSLAKQCISVERLVEMRITIEVGLFQHHGQNHPVSHQSGLIQHHGQKPQHRIMSHNLTVNRNRWLFLLNFLSLHMWCHVHCSSQSISSLCCLLTRTYVLCFELNSGVCVHVCFSKMLRNIPAKGERVNQNRRIRQCGLVITWADPKPTCSCSLYLLLGK